MNSRTWSAFISATSLDPTRKTVHSSQLIYMVSEDNPEPAALLREIAAEAAKWLRSTPLSLEPVSLVWGSLVRPGGPFGYEVYLNIGFVYVNAEMVIPPALRN